MEEVIQIFMRRDGMSREEAVARYNEILDKIRNLIDDGDYEDVEDYWTQETGLEPDYLFDVLAREGL